MSLLSVIVPCYNEEESVALFYRELTKNDPFFKEKEIELELLYIDDGSKDGTVREVKKLIEQDPTLKEIAEQKETLWINPKYLPFELTDAVCQLVVSDADIADAEARLERFAPFIRKCFPETECTNGIIESPLKPIPEMQKALIQATGSPISGNLFLKMDSHLAVAGSVKARGGIYEVLKHAEDLAIAAGKLSETDNYEKLCSDEMRAFFNQYTVQVGSTGNLGLSIGIMSAALGFRVIVHMSADAGFIMLQQTTADAITP